MEKVINNKRENLFLDSLKDIVKSARRFAYNSINLAQLRQNWLIGQKIVIQEQNGNDRAEYGKHIVEIASKELTAEFGKGFSERSLWKFKQFYLTFKDLQILPTMSAESAPLLSWSHYERLLRVKDSNVRKWYEEEATKQMWSYRTLNRNINTLYYHRMLSSQAKDIVEQEMHDKTSEFQNDKLSFIKNVIRGGATLAPPLICCILEPKSVVKNFSLYRIHLIDCTHHFFCSTITCKSYLISSK